MKTDTFHSKQAGTTRYHNNNKCTEGNKIFSYDRVRGKGGLQLCEICEQLLAEVATGASARSADERPPPHFRLTQTGPETRRLVS